VSARFVLSPPRAAAVLAVLFLTVSCARLRSADIAAFGADGRAVELLAADQDSAAARLPIDEPGKLRFSFSAPLPLPPASAIELEYTMDAPTSGLLVVFRAKGEAAWALPYAGGSVVRYRFPVVGSTLSDFEIRAEGEAAKSAKEAGPAGAVSGSSQGFQLKAFRVLDRAYGYAEKDGVLFLTPYVYREEGPAGKRLVIDPPVPHRPKEGLDLRVGFSGGRSTMDAGEVSFAYAGLPTATGKSVISVPSGVLPAAPFPLVIEGSSYPDSLILEPKSSRAFPREAIPADPGLILSYRQESWRDRRYEVFRWERFPGILIFDTANYAAQDALFKRIAFFVEKAGYRGRLATDKEIAGLHGWNAHDYRAEDLAAFFETARKTAFPLNTEERELLTILEANGLVVRSAAQDAPIEAGSGAIVSISRESEGYLRSLFMTHECYHGIFFIDEDFRRFAGLRWDGLDTVARRFLNAYFDMHRYDVSDRYLMMNELMAYCLQQPVSGAAKYFGATLPSRMEKDALRRSSLPAKDEASLSWPDLARLFAGEASAFDAYVKGRWGLRAGSVSLVYQISRTNAAR
jgi:hypothetical protein